MKKLLSIAVASFAVEAMAVVTSVPTSPTIGVTQIPLTYKDTIIAVPFLSLADGNNISVTNLVCTNGLSQGDILYVFEDNKYTGWVLAETGWVKAETATPTGVQGTSDGTVASGGAIWISLLSAPAANKTVSIYGMFTELTETALEPATSSADMQNLVANPLQSAATATVTGAAKGDTIIFPQDGTMERYVYNNSRSAPETFVWRKNNVVINPQTIPVGIGQGFWYVRAKGNTEEASISWTAAQ